MKNSVKAQIILSSIVICLILFILITNSRVQGYEISLYDEYPFTFWMLIVSVIFANQLVLFLISKRRLCRNSISAFIAIILFNFILLLIPFIRGYIIYGSGDPTSHMGYMLDIIQTGYIGENKYPMDHILGVITSQITNFRINIPMLLYPAAFYILFIMSVFLIFRIVLDDLYSMMIGMTIAPLLLFGHGNIAFTPNAQANYYAMFIFYLYLSRFLRKNIIQYEFLLVISIIMITFFHPLVCILVAAIFGITDLVYYLSNKLNIQHDIYFKNSRYLVSITLCIFFIWQSYAYIFFRSFIKIFQWLQGEAMQSSFEKYSGLISETHPSIVYLMISFLYVYGVYFTLIALALISIAIIINASRYKNIYFLICASSFVCFLLFFIVSKFIVGGTGFERIGHWAVLFSIFLVPMGFGYLFNKAKLPLHFKKIFSVIFILIILSLTYLSVFTIFMSPLTKNFGQHVTDSQIVGSKTFLEIKEEKTPVLESGISVLRMKDALYGRSKKVNSLIVPKISLPDHFGYLINNHFENTYGNPIYFILSTRGRIGSQKIYPEFPRNWRFNQSDFNKLENDISVSKVYSNKELDIFLISPLLEGS